MTFNRDEYPLQAHLVKDSLLTLALLGPLYGVLTVFSVLSARALMQRRTRTTRSTIAILSLTIFALFASTTINVVTYTLSTQYSFLNMIKYSTPLIEYPNPATFTDHLPLQNCAGNAAITINITLGDAIVCWRACVIWQKNRIVRAVCTVFVLATFALGVVDTFMGCRLVALLGPYASTWTPTQTMTLYDGVSVGIAICVMSLTTNLMATLLVTYKAWRSRRRLRGYILTGSRVEKLFALLIESGAMYCLMWVLFITFQVAENNWTIRSREPVSVAGLTFLDIFGVVFSSASIPVIALYPMVIIVLVALDRSHIEKGLSQHLEEMTTPNLAVTVPISETAQYRRSEALVIGFASESPGYLDGTKASAREPELIV